MHSMWKAVPTIAGLFVFGSAANAADMGDYPPLPSAPSLLQSAPLLVDEFSSGWYLRGDLGYRFNDVDDATNIGAPPAVGNNNIDDSWLIGGGFGYKWEWLRADLTVDYGTRADFSGDSGIRRNDFRTSVDSATALVNFYGDLGTWYGLTPYVGVGAGIAYLQAADFRIASIGGPSADSSDAWNFAWAYMAGVSYRLWGNYHIDLGYRHINMGDVNTGFDSFGNQLALKKVSSDEVRLGFRYVID